MKQQYIDMSMDTYRSQMTKMHVTGVVISGMTKLVVQVQFRGLELYKQIGGMN